MVHDETTNMTLTATYTKILNKPYITHDRWKGKTRKIKAKQISISTVTII